MRLRLSTWSDITLVTVRVGNRASEGPVLLPPIMLYIISHVLCRHLGSATGIQEEMPKSHPTFHLSKVNSKDNSYFLPENGFDLWMPCDN